ncbi:MAG: DNA recombination protein RmuC [Arsenophonus sp.]|nr:MAG: DNA recombination protein RmuC [Arsenophonus sp.]
MNVYLLYTMIGFFTGIFFSSTLLLFYTRKKINKKKIELQNLYTLYKNNYKEKFANSEQWKIKCEDLIKELQTQQKINQHQAIKLQEVMTRLEETRLAFAEKQRLLLNNEERLNIQFENLANRIFEKNERRVSERNHQNLITLLKPFREQLENFQNQINHNFSKEERERYTLIDEIHRLQKLNIEITKETTNLTKALKGDNKIQGSWGETILTRILEDSGLREGHEFQTQVRINNNANNHYYQPDVIIHLPKNKDIIIDAKMSLTAYERYFNSENEEQKTIALQEHILSVKNHIKALGKKEYHELNGLKTLDYVLMFIPLEPAYLITLRKAPELIEEGLKNNILLVCPSTLLVAIRTINNLWRYEKQCQNAQLIADRAAKIYDKIRLFISDMQIIGQSLTKAQIHYQSAIKKLTEGKGNLIHQAETLKELGIKVKRPIEKTFHE